MSDTSIAATSPSVASHAQTGTVMCANVDVSAFASRVARYRPTSAARSKIDWSVYLVSVFLAPEEAMIACAAASRAIGTRNGLHDT